MYDHYLLKKKSWLILFIFYYKFPIMYYDFFLKKKILFTRGSFPNYFSYPVLLRFYSLYIYIYMKGYNSILTSKT